MSLEAYGSTLASGGLAFIGGLMIGYFIKKILKLIAIVLGFIFTIFAYLTYQNIVRVNWNELQSTSEQIARSLLLTLSSILNNSFYEISWSIAGGITAGFAIGVLKG